MSAIVGEHRAHTARGKGVGIEVDGMEVKQRLAGVYVFHAVFECSHPNIATAVSKNIIAKRQVFRPFATEPAVIAEPLVLVVQVENAHPLTTTSPYTAADRIFDDAVVGIEALPPPRKAFPSGIAHIERVRQPFDAIAPCSNPQSVLAVDKQRVSRVHLVVLRILDKGVGRGLET